MPLILQLSLDNGVTLTVPPSETPTEIRVFMQSKLTPTLVKLGFAAPDEVKIVLDKAGSRERRGGLDHPKSELAEGSDGQIMTWDGDDWTWQSK